MSPFCPRLSNGFPSHLEQKADSLKWDERPQGSLGSFLSPHVLFQPYPLQGSYISMSASQGAKETLETFAVPFLRPCFLKLFYFQILLFQVSLLENFISTLYEIFYLISLFMLLFASNNSLPVHCQLPSLDFKNHESGSLVFFSSPRRSSWVPWTQNYTWVTPQMRNLGQFNAACSQNH